MVEEVLARSASFDVIHSHLDIHGLPLGRRATVPVVTTLHGRLDLPELDPVFAEFAEAGLVSISDAQRAPRPHARWLGTVHHGYPLGRFRATRAAGEHFAFLGRISPEKRLDRAIAIARAADRPLVVAAKIDPTDRAYFHVVIEPLLGADVSLIGEVDDRGKQALLGGARALLFPIDWPEPFGLVMIEALACGTPVVAMRRGSVPEVLDDGVTGFVCDDLDAAIAAARGIDRIERAACRAAFEARFTVARMAAGYEEIYHRLVGRTVTLAS
jgi:glycosyltransferase involved in cell wall biosynthesis